MELNQFRNVDIVLDKANDNIIQKQFVSAGDKDGRSLTAQLTDNGVIGEIVGAAMNLYWHNQASGLTDLSAFYVVDRATSVFKIDYPQNMLTPGKVIAYIQILHGGKVTHTKPFEITVQNLAGTTRGVLATAEYSALVTTLAKANEFETEFTAQLAQKVSKGNVSVADINKNRGKLDQTYMTDDFLQQIVGEAPVNAVPAENSVTMDKLADKAVIPRKLHGATSTKNMFDKSLITLNKYPRPSNGIIEDGEYLTTGMNAMSDFIEVEEETDYCVTKYSIFCFYDVNKNFISGSQQYTLKSPLGAYYLLLGIKSGDAATQQLEKGTQPTNYEPYGFEVDGLRVSEYENRLNELKDINIGKTKNLFNKNTVKLNYYPHLSTGVPTQGAHASGMSAMSEFIEIKPNTDYTGSKYTGFVFYDQNKEFISSLLYYGVKSPSNAKYLRVGIKTIDVDLYQLEEGTDVTYYVEYGNTLEDITIPKYEEAFRGLETILETLVEV